LKCISVYTKDFGAFSEIYESIISAPPQDNEVKEFGGIFCGDSGEVEEDYMRRLSAKPETAVMRDKKSGAVILQHGEVFEIFMPSENPVTP